MLIDHEYTQLVEGIKIPTIVSHDTGKPDDPYELFLASGRDFSFGVGHGWEGLDAEADENASAVLCYTSVFAIGARRFIDIFPQIWHHWQGMFHCCDRVQFSEYLLA